MSTKLFRRHKCNCSFANPLLFTPPPLRLHLHSYTLLSRSYSDNIPKDKHANQNNISNSGNYIDVVNTYLAQPTLPLQAKNSFDRLGLLQQLFKIKLSALVLCTTVTGFFLVPGVDLYYFSTSKVLLNTLIGTALCSFSANSFNQWIEASYDAQMKRTKSRPLPQRQISLPNAFFISAFVGIGGASYLYFLVSGLSSFIAASTIVLYAGVYTPMKRMSILNTWVGSIVGALPPLIGWTAAMQCASVAPPSYGWIPIFVLLYLWQFPHFFSLSWNLRRDYARAGYKMCSLLNPELAIKSSFRHTIALFPAVGLFYLMGLTNIYYVVAGSLINCIILLPAIDFKIKKNATSARKLFFASLIHLPLLLASIFIFKQ